MQRVRIGVTGLAFVFMLVMLGMVFTSPSEEAPITANGLEQELSGAPPAPAPPPAASEPKEPLAELGVAPGNADQNKSDPAASSAAPAGR
ncbi:MAG TPA: hypothetical protein VEZ70_13475 [Allosphingosinicella sp.]|nr:hypothetical protein [Allosphingosinicella sp.]